MKESAIISYCKRLPLVAAAALLAGGSARAIVANPEPATVIQPDGTAVTLQLYGDERYSYTLTADGYGVVYNADSHAWEYAAAAPDGTLATTGIAAADGLRPAAATLGLRPARPAKPALAPPPVMPVLGKGGYDYSRFRGLVILVEYNDRPFSRSDIRDVIDGMINQHDYDGYMSTSMIPEKIAYTGSVRDYFYDNSMGVFDPVFDVVGPVSVDYSMYDMRKSTNAQNIVGAAIEAADELVDYSLYDGDGNREVDMVYLIFSGAGANFSGNDSRLLWPHASQLMSQYRDGVSLNRYACSCELYGREQSTQLDGIGTMCHEFSHVLGLPDEYDTDYEGSGGQSVHPSRWSLMASGSYLNASKTPCGYSLYQRYAAGFAVPTAITAAGDFMLEPLAASGTGYRIDSSTKDEYFLLENRQNTGWDEYLPGHGMLVYRVDSTNVAAWENNDINVNPSHNYYELIRARAKASSSGTVTDSDGDPFPGSAAVSALDNFTTPNLRSWKGIATPVILADIAENDLGNITFRTAMETIDSDLEDFETIAPFAADTAGVEGRFCAWDFTGSRVEAPDGEDRCLGSQAVAMVKGAEVATSAITRSMQTLSFTYFNPTAAAAIVRCYYSKDGGATWTIMKSLAGSDNQPVAAGSTATIDYSLIIAEGSRLRITQFTGSATDKCYLDNVSVTYEKPLSGIDGADDDGGGYGDAPAVYYNLQGLRVDPATASGLVIVSQGRRATKKIIQRQ